MSDEDAVDLWYELNTMTPGCWKCQSFRIYIPDDGPYVCADCGYQEGDDPKEKEKWTTPRN